MEKLKKPALPQRFSTFPIDIMLLAKRVRGLPQYSPNRKNLPKLYCTTCLLFSKTKIVYKSFKGPKFFFYYKSPNFSPIDFTRIKIEIATIFFHTYIALQHAPTCRDVEKYHVVFQKRHWLRDFMAPIQAVGISQTYSRHTIVVRDKSGIYTRNPNFFWPNYCH